MMSIDAMKLKLIEQLMQIREERILNRVQDMIKKERLKYYKQELHPMKVEELEEKLKQSALDIKEGKTYTTDEVKDHFKSRAKNG